MDATENIWRAYTADQIAAMHECMESRQDATDARVETYHEENRQGREQVLNAIEEVKHELRTSQMWISAEETQRERDALLEAGKQLERERWLSWLHRVQGFINEIWQWIGKPAVGAGLAYLVYTIR